MYLINRQNIVCRYFDHKKKNKNKQKKHFHVVPWCYPWPCVVAPRYDGTRHCSCWDSGWRHLSTPSSLGAASRPDGHWAAGFSQHQPALLHLGAAAAVVLCRAPQQRTDVRSVAAPSVYMDTQTELELTGQLLLHHFLWDNLSISNFTSICCWNVSFIE